MGIQSQMIDFPFNGHTTPDYLVQPIWRLALVLLFALVLTACAPDTPTPVPAETDTPAPAETDTLTEAVTDEATEAPVEDGVTDAANDEATDEPGDDTSDPALPDLAFSGFSIEMEGHTPGMCVEAYGAVTTTVCIRNQGEGDAGQFAVSGGVPEFTVDDLPAGEEMCHVYTSSPGEVVIDPEDEVAETDETNNTTFIPVATPPAICTPVSDAGGGSDSAAATDEPTESTDEVVDALCAANGGLQWTGTVCVCPGVVDVVTICGDGIQIDSVTNQACDIDVACDGSGGGSGGGSDGGGTNPCEPWPACGEDGGPGDA